MRWTNNDTARYYQTHLVMDLFGEWTLVAVWGGLGSRRGRMRSTGVASYEDGLAQIEAIAKRRQRHGYTRTSEAVGDGSAGLPEPHIANGSGRDL